MQLATLCYIKKNNQILMLQRNKMKSDLHRDKWLGLGGRFEFGETPEECILREVKEESGLVLKNLKLKGSIFFPAFELQSEDWHVYVFVSTKFEGSLTQSREGKLKWINESELLNLNLWPADRIFLPWLKQRKFFSAKFVYKKEKLANYKVIFY